MRAHDLAPIFCGLLLLPSAGVAATDAATGDEHSPAPVRKAAAPKGWADDLPRSSGKGGKGGHTSRPTPKPRTQRPDAPSSNLAPLVPPDVKGTPAPSRKTVDLKPPVAKPAVKPPPRGDVATGDPVPPEPTAAPERETPPAADEETAEPEKEADFLTAVGELRVVSTYFWKGYDVSYRVPALQPWGNFTLGQTPLAGLSLGFWATMAFDQPVQLDEWNLMLAYHFDVTDTLGLSAGYNFYYAPDTVSEPVGADDTITPDVAGEAFAMASVTLDPIYVQLMYLYGVGSAAGHALQAFTQVSIPVVEKFSLEPYVQVDWSTQFLSPGYAFIDTLAAIDAGLVFHFKFGHVGVLLVGSAIIVPSPSVRDANESLVPKGGALVNPFGAVAVAWEAE